MVVPPVHTRLDKSWQSCKTSTKIIMIAIKLDCHVLDLKLDSI